MKTRMKLLIALMALGAAMTVNAGTLTDNLEVTAQILGTCSALTAGSVAFGTYDPTAVAPTEATGTISVTCTLGTLYKIALGDGTSYSSGTRHMTGTYSSGSLAYDLYQDAARLVKWGDGDPDPVSPATLWHISSGAATDHTVYGRIPEEQAQVADEYADTVVVTLTYGP